ncbi:putative E3 ubiquitin-protein ligase dtx2 [Mortierella polycephala]|uniref:RING-type E3 ubiquitin transferase n=1 Tax=Mortierella polycephala TaxID=41804 RepID=A0A9P6Q636_9FUNG|nr:putative E3 ubiquitin-protein ligase dtx2 [Mortierella polycephala]
MPLIRTSRTEFSDQFKPFFENCPPELERTTSIPYDRTAAIAVPRPLHDNKIPGLDESGEILLMNLDPKTFPDLCNTIGNDFYSRTRDGSDYHIQSVHVLRNPVLWRRYQAEKLRRRQLAEIQRKMREHTRAQALSAATAGAYSAPLLPFTTEEDDPEELFRDEIMYHGTHQRRIPSILIAGLDPRMSVRAFHGKGVYFSDSIEKCMQYVDPQTSMHQEHSIILSCVLLGRVLVESYDRTKRILNSNVAALPDGYDSTTCGEGFKEWIIFDKAQILPLCVINFRTTNRPDSYFRLSSPFVLYCGTNAYPSGMHTIQRVCKVPTPTNAALNNNDVIKEQQWHVPDDDMRRMLSNVFLIRGDSKVKVCISQHAAFKEWIIHHTESTGKVQIASFKEPADYQLFGMSKNIQLLRDRMNERKNQTLIIRYKQKEELDQEISKIPNGQWMMARMAELAPEMLQIQRDIQEKNAAITQNPHMADQYQGALTMLVNRRDAIFSSFAPWSLEQLAIGERILLKMNEFYAAIREDGKNEEREASVIQEEAQRSYWRALTMITIITQDDLNRGIAQADISRRTHGLKEEFKMTITEVDTCTIQIWPQVVAEQLMFPLLAALIPRDKYRQMNEINPYFRMDQIRVLGLDDIKDWWGVPHRLIFDATPASYLLWPIDPRRRIQLPRLQYMKFYIEWMFMERENRIRLAALRQSQPGSQSQTVPPQTHPKDLLQGLDINQFLREQWNELDPSILPAIERLRSRSGTVVFNREQRQRELDQMGASLLNELFVPAEAHMLIRDKAPSTPLASSTVPTAECPICQDDLELPDPKIHNSTHTAMPDKVVKLKSCRHCFHEDCIKEWFQSETAQLKCPMCNTMCTTEAEAGATKSAIKSLRVQKLGPMPDGVMAYSFDDRLACYFIYIVLPAHDAPADDSYSSSGTNANATGTVSIRTDIRYAIVPFSSRLGPLLLIRLICLFYYGHLFRRGRSLTRGMDNVVVWNGVHLRTTMTGEYGFPAPNFESNCWEEIDRKGVAMGLEELVLSMPLQDGSMPASPLDVQNTTGVELPEELAQELEADARFVRMFHQDQPYVFALD